MSSVPLARTIAAYLTPWQQESWPIDWNTVFGRAAPLRLELGFGNGDFLQRSALAHPDVNWVGAEISWGSVKRLLKRLQDHGIENVRVLQGDGHGALRRLFAGGTLQEVIINHSDPWPKKRHHGRRLIQAPFLHTLTDRLAPGGQVLIVTDHHEYAAWIEDHLKGEPGLQSSFPTAWVETLPDHGSTKYKMKGIEAGSTIHHFVWHRITAIPSSTEVKNEVPEMPNVLLDGTCEFEKLFLDFEPLSWRTEHRGEAVFLQLESAYLRKDGGEWLVEARSQEGGFIQHFAIAVSRRRDSRVLFKLSPIGNARPTWGVRTLLENLAAWILHRNPHLSPHKKTPREPSL